MGTHVSAFVHAQFRSWIYTGFYVFGPSCVETYLATDFLAMLYPLDCVKLKTAWFHVFNYFSHSARLLIFLTLSLFTRFLTLVFFSLAGFIAAAEIHNLWLLWQDQGRVPVPPSTIPQVQTETLSCTQTRTYTQGEAVAYHSLMSAALWNREHICRLYMHHLMLFFFIEHIFVTVATMLECGIELQIWLPCLGQKLIFL